MTAIYYQSTRTFMKMSNICLVQIPKVMRAKFILLFTSATIYLINSQDFWIDFGGFDVLSEIIDIRSMCYVALFESQHFKLSSHVRWGKIFFLHCKPKSVSWIIYQHKPIISIRCRNPLSSKSLPQKVLQKSFEADYIFLHFMLVAGTRQILKEHLGYLTLSNGPSVFFTAKKKELLMWS